MQTAKGEEGVVQPQSRREEKLSAGANRTPIPTNLPLTASSLPAEKHLCQRYRNDLSPSRVSRREPLQQPSIPSVFFSFFFSFAGIFKGFEEGVGTRSRIEE